MKALIQRVTEASVSVKGDTIGSIGPGLLVLLGIEQQDNDSSVEKMAERLLAYRIFSDTEGKMNLSVRDIAGSLLIVSQFTLAADTRKGLRPSFSCAAKPDQARWLYESLANTIKQRGITVATGQFAADMQVSLVNDGPVTFMLEI